MQIVDIRLTKLLFRVHKPDKSEGRDLYSLCVSLNSCEKICVGTVVFVDPGYLILVAEVVDADPVSYTHLLHTCEYLEKERGAKVTYLDVDENGFIDLDELQKAITPETILISVKMCIRDRSWTDQS